MKTREHNPEGALSNDSDAKPFRMLAIYDSEATNREATHTSNLVLRELGDSVEADRTTWNIHSLTPDTLPHVASEAARADVIVISLTTDKPSASLKNWVKQWERNRELTSGLLALIPAGESETGGDLADFLYETAVTAQMDFLCQKKHRTTA
jgi:hypothetical protein